MPHRAAASSRMGMLSLPGFQAAWEADSAAMRNAYKDGDGVHTWFDTGGAYDVPLSPHATGTPILEHGVNGASFVKFKKENKEAYKRPQIAGLPRIHTPGQTIYAVVRRAPTASTSWHYMLTMWDGGSANHQYFSLGHHDGQVHYQVRTLGAGGEKNNYAAATVSAGGSAIKALLEGVWTLVTCRFVDDTLQVFLNGVGYPITTTALGSRIQPAASDMATLSIGDLRNDYSYTFGGGGAAYYLYNEGHSDSVKKAAEEHLMTKHSIPM